MIRIERQLTQERTAGFSLIEVMVSMVILLVGLLALAQMMGVATSSNTLSGRRTSATALAKEQLERLKAAPFYTNPAAKTVNPLLLPSPADSLDNPAVGYVAFFDPDGQPTAAGTHLFEVRWNIQSLVPTSGAPGNPLSMLRIEVRCMPAEGAQDPFAIVGEARFVTFRTANVG